MSPQRPPTPPGNFCRPLARSPISSAAQGRPLAASFGSLARCSSRRLASSAFCRACSSERSFFHEATSSLVRLAASPLFAGSASSLPHRASKASFSKARHISCNSSSSCAERLHFACTAFFARWRRPFATTCFCLRTSFSWRSLSSCSACSCKALAFRSSSTRRLASSSSCLSRALRSFSSRFFASRSSRSARSRGSKRSAASTRLMILRRSSATCCLRTFWFCRSIHLRSSRNSASSGLYSSCMEKSRQDSKLSQKS
mmetsp:Transcript_83787/g.234786  ORF Transcript_83787/g.234786 Transcript_83787/m.234786 type:complete len:258 (+) Transcript_83787:159-932(+)